MKIKDRTKVAQRVTWVGFFVNLLLSTFKIIAGISAKSAAMVADGVHSFSDFITDVFVLIFIRFSDKDKDQDHHYGHGKYETFATLLISIALILVGVGIFWNGITMVVDVWQGKVLQQPEVS